MMTPWLPLALHRRRAWMLCLCCVVGAIFLFLTRPSSRRQGLEGAAARQAWTDSASHAGQIWLGQGTPLQGAAPARVVFSPSGRWCVSAGKRLMLWNARTGASVRVLLGPQASGLGFSPFKAYFIGENDIVVVTSHNVYRLDLAGRVRRRYFGRGTYRGIFSPAILPDRREIALVMDDPFRPYRSPDNGRAVMRRLNLQTGQLSVWKGDFESAANISAMKIGKSSMALLMPQVRIRLLNSRGLQKWSRPLPFTAIEDDGASFFRSIALCRNGNTLFYLDAKSGLIRLDTRALKATRLLAPSDFTTLTLSPDERFLLLSNAQGRVAITNLKTRQLVRQAIFPFSAGNLVFSPDGNRLAIGGMAIVPFDIR